MTGQLSGNGSSSSPGKFVPIIDSEEWQANVHEWSWFWISSAADRDSAIASEPGLQTPEAGRAGQEHRAT
jgi:hypothetical protein